MDSSNAVQINRSIKNEMLTPTTRFRVIKEEMAIKGRWPFAAIFSVYMLRKIDFVSFKSALGAATCLKLLSKFGEFCEIEPK